MRRFGHHAAVQAGKLWRLLDREILHQTVKQSSTVRTRMLLHGQLCTLHSDKQKRRRVNVIRPLWPASRDSLKAGRSGSCFCTPSANV